MSLWNNHSVASEKTKGAFSLSYAVYIRLRLKMRRQSQVMVNTVSHGVDGKWNSPQFTTQVRVQSVYRDILARDGWTLIETQLFMTWYVSVYCSSWFLLCISYSTVGLHLGYMDQHVRHTKYCNDLAENLYIHRRPILYVTSTVKPLV